MIFISVQENCVDGADLSGPGGDDSISDLGLDGRTLVDDVTLDEVGVRGVSDNIEDLDFLDGLSLLVNNVCVLAIVVFKLLKEL